MKKLCALLLAMLCLLALAGCEETMDDITKKYPGFVGVVEETEKRLVVRADPKASPAYSGLYQISTDDLHPDSMTAFSIGDRVAVYYDGVILEIYPAIVKDAKAIVLLEPADRGANEQE